MKTKHIVASLVAVIVWLACTDTPVEVTGGGTPGALTDGPLFAGMTKTALCHRDADNPGTYIQITIADPAVAAHRDHGDAGPGEDVPDVPGKRFTATCELVDVIPPDAYEPNDTWADAGSGLGSEPAYFHNPELDKSDFYELHFPDHPEATCYYAEIRLTDIHAGSDYDLYVWDFQYPYLISSSETRGNADESIPQVWTIPPYWGGYHVKLEVRHFAGEGTSEPYSVVIDYRGYRYSEPYCHDQVFP